MAGRRDEWSLRTSIARGRENAMMRKKRDDVVKEKENGSARGSEKRKKTEKEEGKETGNEKESAREILWLVSLRATWCRRRG